MSLDWGMACLGAGEAADDDVVACTSDGVCPSPFATLGEGKDA